MALLILPVGFVLGLVIRDARRASLACALIWLAAMVAWTAAKLGGIEVSPWEALALTLCLVPAIALARLAARLRRPTVA